MDFEIVKYKKRILSRFEDYSSPKLNFNSFIINVMGQDGWIITAFAGSVKDDPALPVWVKE